MNITCTICSDLFQPSDDIFDTPCGHVFHYGCLTQWLERSKTCPQCRHVVLNDKIQRLYFNFSNDIGTDNPVSLQATVDSLQFQNQLKGQEIRKCLQQLEDEKRQNFTLLEDLKKQTKQLENKESIVFALKEQAQHFQSRLLRLDESEKKVAELTQKLNQLKNLQTLLNGRNDKDDEKLLKCDDPSNLIIYISILKSELNSCMKRKQTLKEENQSLNKELTHVKKKCKLLSDADQMKKQLEKELIQCESEKLILEMKLEKLDKSIENAKDSVTLELDNTLNNTIRIESPKTNKESGIKDSSFVEKQDEIHDLLTFNSLDKFMNKPKLQQPKVPSNLSILSKNKPRVYPIGKRLMIPRLDDPDVCSNGLGGHSRIDRFPEPKNKKAKFIKSWMTDSG